MHTTKQIAIVIDDDNKYEIHYTARLLDLRNDDEAELDSFEHTHCYIISIKSVCLVKSDGSIQPLLYGYWCNNRGLVRLQPSNDPKVVAKHNKLPRTSRLLGKLVADKWVDDNFIGSFSVNFPHGFFDD